MTDLNLPESSPVDAEPTLPPNSGQIAYQQPAVSSADPDTASSPLSQSQSSLLRRRVSGPTAVLVFMMVIGLAGVIAGSYLLLRNARIGVTPVPQPVQANEMAPTAQVASATQPALTVTSTVSMPALEAVMPVAPETETPAAPSWLTEAESEYRLGVQARDFGRIERLLVTLSQATEADSRVAAEASELMSQIAYARDTLTGTVYLNGDNLARWQLTDAHGAPLTYPIDMTINDGSIYLLDSGSLYRADLAALPAGGGVLSTTAVLTPGQSISGYPVKELVAIDGAAYTDAVFALDKSNDIYRYQPSSGNWSLELPLAREYQNPDPFYQNLGTYSDRLYMLDPARNEIWRHSDDYLPPEYFASHLPWLLEPGDPDVSSGLDMVVDGNIYVLSRVGSIEAYDPSPLANFTLPPAAERSLVAGLQQAPAQPIALANGVDGFSLYVVDPGQRRVVVLDRRDGRFLRQFIAPDITDFAYLHAAAEHNGRLLLLAASRLYGIDLSTGITATVPLTGQLPLLAPLPEADRAQLRPADMAPNDPRLPAIIASYGFTMPLKGALLPDRSAIYPGSRRAYRYGVHEGLDIYGRDVGVDMSVGTPVVAAADGLIMRADVGYQELAPQVLSALLDDANARHDTPRDSLNMLGGRQVWIDHGDGLVTAYMHLDSIAEGIAADQPVKAGQLIGTVGVSGTPDGAAGITQFAHLHFEIRIGDQQQYYLGQWLSIEETRRAFERIFQVPVRPAYLEFRQN